MRAVKTVQIDLSLVNDTVGSRFRGWEFMAS